MRCAACEHNLDAFTGDVCPQCHRFAHPTKLGIYSDLELIKRGGMGSVYRARHPELGTIVAIKTVHTHTGPEKLGERFEQEARLAARIPHPGVVRVFDYDSQDGRLYLVMEHIDGDTLRAAIEANHTTQSWRLETIARLADVLHEAHQQGIVHRDIKPENVMVDSTGRVRVLDFGISCVLDDGERLTQTGEILGTPEYIAPEQILDVPEAVDARTDIYALGVVLYELLTGRSPFAGANLFQVLKNVESLDPPPPSELVAGISRELDSFVMSCLAKEPNDRPADCRTVARRLRELAPESTVARPTSPSVLTGLGLIGIAIGLAIAWLLREPSAPATPVSPATRIRSSFARDPNTIDTATDRSTLDALARAIPDSAAPKDLYWRGRVHLHHGRWFLAARDFEAAKGVLDTTHYGSIAAFLTHRLLPALLGCPDLDAVFVLPHRDNDPLALARTQIVSHELDEAIHTLDTAPRSADKSFLHAFAQWSKSGSVAAESIDTENLNSSDLRFQLLRLLTQPAEKWNFDAILADLDRLSPIRYVLEMIAAHRSGDDAGFRAALELAQVAGVANYAQSLYAAVQLDRYAQLNAHAKAVLADVTKNLHGPNAETLRAALREKKRGG